MFVLAVIILFFIKEQYFSPSNEENKEAKGEQIVEENIGQVDVENIVWEYPVDMKEGDGSLGIFVTDGNKEGVDNSMFEVTDSEGNKIASLGTNEKGLTGIKGLQNGTYYIEQTYVKDKYKADSKRYRLEITDEGKNFHKVILNGIEDSSTYIISLVDDEENPIQGAQFEVFKNGEKIHTLTTDEDGYAGVRDMGIGTYYFKQVSTKEGYKISDETYEFIVTEDGQIVRQDIVNEKGE